MYAISCSMRKSPIFYAKSLTGRTCRTIYVRSRYKKFQQINKIFSKKKILTLSFTFLYLPSLASCAVNRSSPHDPVVTGPRKGQAHQHPSVSKTRQKKKCSSPLRMALFVSCRYLLTQPTNTAPRSSGRSASWITPRISSRFFAQDL